LKGTLLSTGQALAFNAVGWFDTHVLDVGAGSLGSIAMHGLAGGLFSVAGGGKFQSGFLAAGFAELAGPHLEIDGNGTGVLAANTAINAVTGGIASVLGGVKFENGAVTGAFGYLFNQLDHPAGEATPEDGQRVVDTAKNWLGTRYALVGDQSLEGRGGDCTGSVWKIYQEAGLPYPYAYAGSDSSGFFQRAMNTDDFPFVKVATPQPGDVVYWPGHAMLYAGKDANGNDIVIGAFRTGRAFGEEIEKYMIKSMGVQSTYFRYQYKSSGL
jgi:hypothetical protein